MICQICNHQPATTLITFGLSKDLDLKVCDVCADRLDTEIRELIRRLREEVSEFQYPDLSDRPGWTHRNN